MTGRAVGLEFRLRSDLVSVARVESSCAALFDRVELGRWLADALAGFPMVDLVVDEVRLSVGPGGLVAVSMDRGGLGQPAIDAWELSPRECQALLEAV
jgi:uncharacterized protein (DUF1501 family)